MRPILLVLGVLVLAYGFLLFAKAAERNETVALFDPGADRATGSVRIVASGETPWTFPAEVYRGRTYTVYDRLFEVLELPDDVERVEFTVHFSYAPAGIVEYPFADRFLPTAESYSGRHVASSLWIPPYGGLVRAAEATHTFRAEGDTWRAVLELDTEDVPPGPYEWVLGTRYVAHRADGTSGDVQGIVGADRDPTFEVRENEWWRLLQGARVAAALVAVAGFALVVWGAVAKRRA